MEIPRRILQHDNNTLMTNNGVAKTALLALNSGLPPCAEALDCDDLRGPRSLFGESAPMPRPIGEVRFGSDGLSASRPESRPANRPDSRPEGRPDSRAASRSNGRSASGLESCRLLWEAAEPASCYAEAAKIASEAGPVHAFDTCTAGLCRLNLPATVYICGTCTSTFDIAWRLSADGLMPEWGAVISSRQTGGRGQMRRAWHSPRGNLYVTFRLPSDPLLKGDCASLLVGWLLVSAFRRLGFSLSLKWPNDLLLEERFKVGGVLLEERDGVLMAGLGVNLAEAPGAALMRGQDSLPAAVLLPDHSALHVQGGAAAESGEGEEPLAPFPLWRRLVSEVILEYSQSLSGNRLADTLCLVNASLAWKGRNVVVRDGGDRAEQGRFMGLGPCGGMLLSPCSGERRELFSGSLFLR